MVILTAISFLLVTGCAKQVAILGKADPGTNFEDRSHFFISGLDQRKLIDAVKICGTADNVAEIETSIKFLDGLLATITLGIYTPFSYRVACKESV